METKMESTPESHVEGREFLMTIGGERVAAEDGRVEVTVDPSTGQPLAEVPQASAADVGRAIEAAEAAFPAWAATSIEERGECFRRFGELLVEHREELAALDALDSGNPIKAMRLDVMISLDYVKGWPPLAQALTGEVIPASPGNLHYTSSRPYGVVGRITAFNHPLMFAATRPLASLITGNTLVLKPAPQTSLSTLVLGELFDQAFPAGVVNVISGGAEPGDALVSDGRVKRIAFTGSVPTGLLIQRRAAESGWVKHLSLELGGKNAMVIFPDVDVEAAVDGAIFGMNFNVCQGQSCGSNSRVLVHRGIYDEFVQRAGEALARTRVGPAAEEASEMGPLVSAQHLERVNGFVAAGRSEGATLVTGGERPEGVPEGGFFLAPTMFADVAPEMKIAREEIFGPVMSVTPWDDYEGMIELANGVDLGLTASIWTHDLDLAHRTAERMDAGYVWVNDSTRHYFGTPFGGTKNSGIGREESVEELRSYLETRVVHTRLSDPGAALERMLGGDATSD
ncbi:MAG: aldehyde dehydrogenase family protein [Actinobacteria bacterium]|nr:aldehyde dehydrogenase family protein [Actinomycetota bacterium]